MTSHVLDEAVLERISASASSHLNDLLASLVRRREQRMVSAQRGHALNEALVRLVPEEELADLLGAGQGPDRAELVRRLTEASSTARHSLAQSASDAVARNADVLSGLQEQVLAPPYDDRWRWEGGLTGDAEATAYADRDDGTFGFMLATGQGSAAAGAGVWAQFIPDGPAPVRITLTRPLVRYADEWDSNTLLKPYGAHNEGGFGITVLSWNLEGQDQRLEPLFPWTYFNWSKDTGWNGDDHDTNWPSFDQGLSYTFTGNTPPPFLAFTNRIYRIAIFCFGQCDAGGGFFGNGIASSWISARADLVILQEI